MFADETEGEIFFPGWPKQRVHARTHDKFNQPGNCGNRFSGGRQSVGADTDAREKENWAGLSPSPVELNYACCGGSGVGLRTGSVVGVTGCVDQPSGASGLIGADCGGKGGGPVL